MCETASLTAGRPRWGWLYGAALAPLGGLALVEVTTPAGALRVVLRFALALAALAGMALWVRANRAAFDLQNWCECSAETITVRVIYSYRPATPPEPDSLELMPAGADAEPELVHH